MIKGIGGLKRFLSAGLSLSLILGGTGTSLSAQAMEPEIVLEYEQEQEIELEPAQDEEAEFEDSKEDALATQYHDLEDIGDSPDVNRASIHDGTILHAFCWDFNTIRENMGAIAEAGFTAVQTSPINECLSTHDALSLDGTLNGTDGMWYYHYQPTDWKIGNYQLGTREEFKAMCDEADRFGVGIIVDILPNHTTPTDDQISQTLIDAAGGWDNLFHKEYREGVNYNDRVSVTYNAMGGLYDVDTENPDFQNYFYAYLEDCINCGADGFRIDTAKHIALPDDGVPASYEGEEDRNNFYPNMAAALDQYAAETGRKSYDDLFVYGEVLQGDMDRFAAYQQYIGGTTASNYGSSIRSALSNDNFSTSNILSYKIYDDGDYKADEDKLVTWVESHDNYINDKSYAVIDDRDTILGWAVIAARKSGTPLFFSRPAGSSSSEPFGDNVLGAAGNDLYKAPEVAAVNSFRSAMAGKEEYLSNPGGDKHVLMIERLDAEAVYADGAVLVNNSSNITDIKGETKLPDGTYINEVYGSNDIFVVKDGVISGILQPESVVVLSERSDVNYSICHYYNAYGWNEIVARTFYEAGEHFINGINEGDGWYRFYIPVEAYDINFCNAENLDDNSAIYLYDYRHWYDEPYFHPSLDRCYASKEEVLEALGIKSVSVYFFNTDLWENVNCYAWLDGGEQLLGGWPGQAAVNEGDYWYRADLKLPKDHEGGYNVIFNFNGTQTQDIKIDDEKTYVALNADQPGGSLQVTRYASKKEAEEARGISADSTTVHFYNKDKWDTVYTYTWGAYSTGEWPGIPCTDEGDGWWEITIPAAPGADFNIIFNNAGKGAQTSDLKIPDINHRYVYDDRTFASKEEALNAEPEEIIPAYPEGTEVTRIYYYDENNWGKVAAYAWSYDGAYNNCIGTWPGTRMYTGDDGWYYTDVPTEAINNGALKLIFNRMGSSQLGDKELENTTKVYFTTSSATGFNSKAEALGQEPDEPIEPEEPEGRLVKKWGAIYYIYDDGSYGTGFITVDGDTYYFKDNHKALKNAFIEIDGKSYYFDGSCHMVKGFMTKWLNTFYFDENGVEAVSGLVTVDDRTCYFDAKGHMVKSKFVEFEEGRRYFDKDGNMVRSATIKKWGKKYSFDENGILIQP